MEIKLAELIQSLWRGIVELEGEICDMPETAMVGNPFADLPYCTKSGNLMKERDARQAVLLALSHMRNDLGGHYFLGVRVDGYIEQRRLQAEGELSLAA